MLGSGTLLERQAVVRHEITRPGQRRRLTEIGRKWGEVFSVDRAVVIEVPVIPHHSALIEVVRERCEIFAVDCSVKIGITQQGEHNFDLAGRQAGDHTISAIGVTDAITKSADRVGRCNGAAGNGRTGQVIETVLNPCGDGRDWIVSRGVVDNDAIVPDIER